MSLPFELRGLAATTPDVLTALGRIFAEEIARTTKRLVGVADAQTQRGGPAMGPSVLNA